MFWLCYFCLTAASTVPPAWSVWRQTEGISHPALLKWVTSPRSLYSNSLLFPFCSYNASHHDQSHNDVVTCGIAVSHTHVCTQACTCVHTHTHTLMYVHMRVDTHMAQHVLHTTLTHAQMVTYWGQRWLWKRHLRDSFWAGELIEEGKSEWWNVWDKPFQTGELAKKQHQPSDTLFPSSLCVGRADTASPEDTAANPRRHCCHLQPGPPGGRGATPVWELHLPHCHAHIWQVSGTYSSFEGGAGFKIQDYFIISSEKLKYDETLTTSQCTIIYILTVIEKTKVTY